MKTRYGLLAGKERPTESRVAGFGFDMARYAQMKAELEFKAGIGGNR